MPGMPNVVRELIRRGYSNEEIAKVVGQNLMRVYRRVWK
jgi:membrane dipeptidase